MSPLEDLRALVVRSATGEFICAESAVEIHVYLQHGRVAWGTASSRPFEFVRYLRERAGFDDETFRTVIDDCRRDGLPFGETLVVRGLVGAEAVKAALRQQACSAIAALARVPSAETLFIQRTRFAEYRHDLTFDLNELVPEPAFDSPASRNGGAFARQLLDAVEGARWVELFEGQRLVEGAPESPDAPRIPLALLTSTLAEDADFVALRAALGSVIGVRLSEPDRSLWCGLSADSTFGSAVSALGSLNALRARPEPEHGRERLAFPAWALGEQSSRDAVELKAVLDRAPDVLAAAILSSELEPLFAIGGKSLGANACLDLFRRRAPAFSARVSIEAENRASAGLASLGFTYRSLVTGEPDLWCFGAELYGVLERTLWLLTDRSVSQGLGWACLAAARRGLEYGSSVPRRQAG